MQYENRQRLLFVDIETGGTNIRRHPITEIAAIAVEAGTWRELDSIELKIEFNVREADPVALGINKYKPSVWEKYALPPKIAAEKFAIFCRKHATVEKTSKKRKKKYDVAQLVGHNAEQFDGPFLRELYRGHRVFFPGSMRVLCTKQLAMWFFEMNQGLEPPENYKLETLCKYFGLTLPNHTALQDIRATVELARVIATYQRLGVTPQAA